MQKIQFSVALVNKTGELARLSKILARAKVNIEGLALTDGIHTGTIKLVVDQPPRARAALKKAKLQFSEQKVLAVHLPNRPGALAELCAILAQKKMSIDYVYGSTCACDGCCDCDDDCDCRCECACRVLVSVCDVKSAAKLVKGLG